MSLTLVVESMSYFMSNNVSDTTIIKITKGKKDDNKDGFVFYISFNNLRHI